VPDYLREPLERYLRDAACGQPTPGGGSVSALAGALACTMAGMAARLTAGKKKFRHVEAEVRDCLALVDAAREELAGLMLRDTEAYGQVAHAYGLPKDADPAERGRAIQAALQAAMQPPLQGARACARVLQRLPRLAEIANPHLLSDVGVAAVLADAALRGCALTVEANLAPLQDAPLAAQTRQELHALAAQAAADAQAVLARLRARLTEAHPSSSEPATHGLGHHQARSPLRPMPKGLR
jgi:formiminotetrahydrofolate cyclodeaminase